MNSEKTTYQFKTEIKQLLNIIVNFLYKENDVFIRELISNSSDAIEKLKFEYLTRDYLINLQNDYEIIVEINKKENSISIEDNGIGMSKQELIENLGILAKSGTKDFLNKIKELTNKNFESSLIGNFGIGFYSAFIVSNKVIVETRKHDTTSDVGLKWTSDGIEEFSIENIIKKEIGTKVTLFLKEESKYLLNEHNLRNSILKYSSNIKFKIKIKILHLDDKEECKDLINNLHKILDVSKSEISDNDYIEYYKFLKNESKDPLIWNHFKIEGKNEYVCIFYIPSEITFNLIFNKTEFGLNLYSKRVLVQENCKKLLYNYLRFINGIVDIEHLKLNVSRDILQDDLILDEIKTSITKKILSTLISISKNDNEKYLTFWKTFKMIFKEGLIEDINNKDDILQLLRVHSTYDLTEEKYFSLDQYISRIIQEDKNDIFYIFTENINDINSNLNVKSLVNKNIEVLVFTDKIDELILRNIKFYKNFKLISVTDNNLKSLKNEKLEKNYEKFEDLKKKLQDIYKDKISNIFFTEKESKYPSNVIFENEDNLNIKKYINHDLRKKEKTKFILELNTNHPIIKHLNLIQSTDELERLSLIVINQALLLNNNKIINTENFIDILNNFIFKT